MQNDLPKARAVRLVIFDVDGVMTDGTLYLLRQRRGNQGVQYPRRPWHENAPAKAGSSSRSSPADARAASNCARRTSASNCCSRARPTKPRAYAALLAARELEADATAYMGDDVVDLPVLRRCGFARRRCPTRRRWSSSTRHYVTRARGGRGAVREVCEFIMHAQGTLARATRGLSANESRACVHRMVSARCCSLPLAAVTLWLDRQVQPPERARDGKARHDPGLHRRELSAPASDPDGSRALHPERAPHAALSRRRHHLPRRAAFVNFGAAPTPRSR